MEFALVIVATILIAVVLVIVLRQFASATGYDPAEVNTLRTTIADKMAALAAAEARLEEGSKIIERLDADIASERGSFANLQIRCSQLQSSNAALNETVTQVAKQSEEKLQLLIDARVRMTQEFKVLAGDIAQQHGEAFSKQTNEQISVLLGPFQQKVVEFQQGLQNVYVESEKERAALKSEIKMFADSSAAMTMETRNLTIALKGDTKTQGVWGEMMLSTILEKSGLRKGEEYVIQESYQSETGDRLRPDAIVNLPYEHRIVIDAKTSLTAFERYANGTDDAERAANLQQHAASIRTHIKTLGSKAYWEIDGSRVDYVILFIPIEGALRAALDNDPSLIGVAIQQNVTIATPTTLMIALRTVANIWRVERQNRNSMEIADRAGRLYDKFVGFIVSVALPPHGFGAPVRDVLAP
jgi:DNA recombination protein RmuC